MLDENSPAVGRAARAGIGFAEEERRSDTTTSRNIATRATRREPPTRMSTGHCPLAKGPRGLIDFDRINRAALDALPSLLARWLPGGKRHGQEYVVRNPRRADGRPGSFSINIRSGRWADFATGDRGGDVVSLAAFLAGISQYEAAEKLAGMLGVEARHGR
jgi:hypothetical protein